MVYTLLLCRVIIKALKMKEHILIIDSNTIELRKLREILTREGFNIMTATDMATARDLITKIDIKYLISESSFLNEIKNSELKKTNP